METYVSLSIVSTIMSLILAWNIKKRSFRSQFKNFILLMMCITYWSICGVLEILLNDINIKILFGKLSYIGIVSMPVLCFRFYFEYTKRISLLTNWKIRILWIIPIITVILVFTNEFHNLIWTNISPDIYLHNAIILKYERGLWFTIHSVYSYTFLFSGLFFLVIYIIKNKSLKNSHYLILGILSPFIVNVLYILRITFIDYTSAAFTCTCITFAWSIISDSIDETAKLQTKLIKNDRMTSIGQLSAGLAHEINNPLGYIISNTSMLKKYNDRIKKLYSLNKDLLIKFKEISDKNTDDLFIELETYIKNEKIEYTLNDLDELVNENIDGLKRIKNIVNSLLGFAKNNTINILDEYNLNSGIENTLVILENELKKHSIVSTEFGEIPDINASSIEINQVLLNILLNSIYSIKIKKIIGKIHIKTYFDKKYIYCEIEDDGIGIPTNIKNRIFDPFFTTKPVGTGAGLGLSIVYDIIVNKHNGKIEINSTESVSTTVKISIPKI